MSRHPIYVCPHDEAALAVEPKGLRCPKCGRGFPIKEQIALLDIVQSHERLAFDAPARSSNKLDIAQLAAARGKAETFLDVAQIPFLKDAVVLDLGCGFGELTCGLISSDRVQDSHVYAVDHSIESMRTLSRSAAPANRNEVHLSVQDAAALCFPPMSFDVVLASALLHHVLDYSTMLKRVQTMLKPGAKAVFSEPFCYGYLIPIMFLKLAIMELGIDADQLNQPEFGLCTFVIQNLADRVQHEGDVEFLKGLTDKHLFRKDQLAEVSYAAGFTEVTFRPYEPDAFYEGWARHLLSSYGVQHPGLVTKVDSYYKSFLSLVGPARPGIMSHFEYVVLKR